MSRKAENASFTLERRLAFPVAKVFAAWSSVDAKAKWFSGPAGRWTAEIREQDFREGGKERLRGRFTAKDQEGWVSDFRAQYHDIQPEERIVYSYEMYRDEVRLSVSLATITFAADDQGTLMTVTEQGVYLDAHSDGNNSRREGTAFLMEQLQASLQN